MTPPGDLPSGIPSQKVLFWKSCQKFLGEWVSTWNIFYFPQRMHGAPISEEVQAAWGVAQHQQLCPPLIRLSLVVLVEPTPPSTCITVIYFAQSAIFSGQGEVFRNVKTMARDCFPFSHSQEMMMRTCALMDSSVLVPTLINFEQDCCFHFSSIMCWLFSNAFNMCAFRILAQLVAA